MLPPAPARERSSPLLMGSCSPVPILSRGEALWGVWEHLLGPLPVAAGTKVWEAEVPALDS